MAAFSDPDVRWCLTTLADRRKDHRLYRDYLAGKHDLAFSTVKFEKAFGQLFEALAYNRCRAVRDAHTNKLRVVGFAVEDVAATDAQLARGGEAVRDDALAARAMRVWRRNRMDVRAGEIHDEAFGLGDGYAIVWPDRAGLARIYPQHADRCVVHYREDDPNAIDFALKTWQLRSGRWIVFVYREDRVEKFVTQSKLSEPPRYETALEPWVDPADGEQALRYPWGDGVPVFHWGNGAKSGRLGVSELQDVLPLQDALNKSLADLIITEEFQSYRARYILGMASEYDAKGEKVPLTVWPGTLLTSENVDPNAKVGDFAEAQLKPFIDVQDSWDAKISRVTSVPVHWLGFAREFPSGEALRTAETPFTAKIEARQTEFGPIHGDLVAFCLRVEGALTDARTLTFSPIWKPAEPRSDSEFWTVAQLKIAAGVPEEEVWAEAGYGPKKIAEWTAAKEAAMAEMRAANPDNPLDEGADDDEGAA